MKIIQVQLEYYVFDNEQLKCLLFKCHDGILCKLALRYFLSITLELSEVMIVLFFTKKSCCDGFWSLHLTTSLIFFYSITFITKLYLSSSYATVMKNTWNMYAYFIFNYPPVYQGRVHHKQGTMLLPFEH